MTERRAPGLSDDRVRELRVRVRTDILDADTSALGAQAEKMARAALARCGELLEQRAPGRIVVLRRLPLHWRLDETLLDDGDHVEELARAAADAVERMAAPASLEPPSGDAGVIFEDEAHLRACHLLAVARGRPAWFHESMQDTLGTDPLAALASPSRRAIAGATLARLARGRALGEVLAAQPETALAVLAAALGLDGRAAPTGGPAPAAAGAAAPRGPELVDDVATTIGPWWPRLGPAGRALALRVHAGLALGLDADAPETAALVAAAADRLAGVRAPDASTRAEPPAPAAPLREPADPSAGRTAASAIPTELDVEAAGLPPTQSASPIDTHGAGLFYLLDRLQELDAGEALWQACLPEPEVLAAAMAALLGPRFAGDRAPALFGGVETARACPDVTVEQHAEVAAAIAAELGAALPRRGLAALPPVVVSLADHPRGRLLVAAAERSPFAFFAWPAATPAAVEAGVRTLVAAWPLRGELAAPPALAALDRAGRLRARRDAGAPRALHLPDGPSSPAAALRALLAGAPCLLFAARAGTAPDGGAPDTADAFVMRHLARRGRVALGPERMDVVIAQRDLDHDARGAGLDRDPGWIPWLHRAVRFQFEGDGRDAVAPPTDGAAR